MKIKCSYADEVNLTIDTSTAEFKILEKTYKDTHPYSTLNTLIDEICLRAQFDFVEIPHGISWNKEIVE